jgi:MoaA/NifB/PqqE/SkfB family radical SAM enzyme
MRRFRRVHVAVSVDGPDPWFGYIRHGRYTTEDVKRNLDRFLAEGFSVSVTIAYQLYNALSAPGVFREFQSRTRQFGLSIVTTRGLSALVAPEALRKEASRRLSCALDETDLAPRSRARFEDLLGQLKPLATDEEALRYFWKFTHELDLIRGESLAAIDPELCSYLSEYDRP